MNRIRSLAALAVLCLMVCFSSLARGQSPTWTKLANLMVPAPGGGSLATDVYLPSEDGRFPTILTRTPYNKNSLEKLMVPAFTAAGYAVVIQDVRGMGGSSGAPLFIPFVFEKDDGVAALAWTLEQPWCDGRVGMWGPSYLGYCALIVAAENPPGLKAVFNLSGWGDSEELIAPGGAMHLMVGLPWTLLPQLSARGGIGSVKWDAAFRRTPVVDIPKALGMQNYAWTGMASLSGEGVLRDKASMIHAASGVRAPVLHVTGWHDFVARHTLDTHEAIAAESPAGKSQELIVGPWRHDQIWSRETRVGDSDFGPDSAWGSDKVMDIAVRWFDRTVKGEAVATSPPVRLFVMGPNEWRNYESWPPPKVEFQKWHFQSDGKANSASGDGRLSLEPPTKEGRDEFVFDPKNPIPTRGGANCHFFPENLGVKDQREIEEREDVLVYTSAPLDRDLTIIGPLTSTVFASSEGVQTDITVKLVEVRPDGYARIIEDGIRRRPDSVDEKPIVSMDASQTYRFTVDLGGTAIVIPKGNRIRVDVSSSNFPKYTRNPNTGESPETASEFKAVRQTVRHSPVHPSHITLPVLR